MIVLGNDSEIKFNSYKFVVVALLFVTLRETVKVVTFDISLNDMTKYTKKSMT